MESDDKLPCNLNLQIDIDESKIIEFERNSILTDNVAQDVYVDDEEPSHYVDDEETNLNLTSTANGQCSLAQTKLFKELKQELSQTNFKEIATDLLDNIYDDNSLSAKYQKDGCIPLTQVDDKSKDLHSEKDELSTGRSLDDYD